MHGVQTLWWEDLRGFALRDHVFGGPPGLVGVSVCDSAAHAPVETHFVRRPRDREDDQRMLDEGATIPLNTVRILDTDTKAFIDRVEPIVTTINRSDFTTLRKIETNDEGDDELPGKKDSRQLLKRSGSAAGRESAKESDEDFLRSLPNWGRPIMRGEGNIPIEVRERERGKRG